MANIEIMVGNALDVLRGIEANRFQCVVTSPPYFNLRVYHTHPQVWGGEVGCGHEWGPEIGKHEVGRHDHGTGCPSSRLGPNRDGLPGGTVVDNAPASEGSTCLLCGAWRGELGAEPEPALYVAHLLEVFAEVKRVLRPDGVLWLNIGDSYSNASGGSNHSGATAKVGSTKKKVQAWGGKADGVPAKSLCLIPERVLIGLQEQGWIVRNRIVFYKPNAMPTSAKDRFKCCWEHVFLLVKQQKYKFRLEAVKVQAAPDSVARVGRGTNLQREDRPYAIVSPGGSGTKPMKWANGEEPDGYCNPGDVWRIPSQPRSENHFACVDEETEALGKRGWVRQQDLRRGDSICVFDAQANRLRWGTVTEIARYRVENRPMVSVKTKTLDMLLTPNHRCVIRRRLSRTGKLAEPAFVEATSLKKSHSIPTCAIWNEDTTAGPGSNFAELLGWYVAEGHEVRHGWSAELYQSTSANREKADRIRSLLDALTYDYSEVENARTWRGRSTSCACFRVLGYGAMMLRNAAPGKMPRWAILDWPDDDLRAFLEGLVGGDGCVRDGKMVCFIQARENIVDLVQAVGLRLGMTARKRDKGLGGCYNVWLSGGRERRMGGNAGRRSQITTESYTGVVWCPSVQTGAWIARRNGTPFITGNSYPDDLVKWCLLASTDPGDEVLDPFLGRGTTALVAAKMGRNAVGIELNPTFAVMSCENAAIELEEETYSVEVTRDNQKLLWWEHSPRQLRLGI